MAVSPGELAQRVRAERARRRLSQDEAAEAAGLHVNTWRRVEAGRSHPHAPTLDRLAVWLGCDVATLMPAGSSDAVDAAQADAPIVAASLETPRG